MRNLVIIVALVLVTSDLHAQATADPAQAPSPVWTKSVWYGYELLLMDAAALGGGVLVGTFNDGSDRQRAGDVIASTWGFGMIGSMAVHSAHDNAALGLAGVGMRLLLPPVMAVLGVAGQCVGTAGDDDCTAQGGRGGFVIGMLGATLIDSLAFGRTIPERVGAPKDERVWYGYKTLVIDGAALASSLALTVGRDHPDRTDDGARMLAFPYLVGFVVSPWVHAFHGRVGTAFGSLALRALAPALGVVPGIAGYCAASGSETRCTKEGAVWGLFGGTLLVAAIDIGALSYETVESAKSATLIVPFLAPNGDGLVAGLTGAM
jgi:hypothetical protein